MTKKKITKIAFPDDIKSKFNSFLKTKAMQIDYYDAMEISYPNWNVKSLVPFKIIIFNQELEMVILYYGNYMYDPKLYFLYDITNPLTFHKIKELAKKNFV